MPPVEVAIELENDQDEDAFLSNIDFEKCEVRRVL